MIKPIIALITAAIILQVHHYKVHGYWFDSTDLDCHEVWFVGLLSGAAGIAIGAYW